MTNKEFRLFYIKEFLDSELKRFFDVEKSFLISPKCKVNPKNFYIYKFKLSRLKTKPNDK